jgi:hypothetical protein
MDSGCSQHMTGNKKWFSSLTPLSHKEYVTFGNDKKDKVLGTGVIKVNDCFTLNDVALVDRLRYNLFSVSQLCDADLSVLFRKSDSHVLDSFGKRVRGISRIGNVFQANFSSPAAPSISPTGSVAPAWICLLREWLHPCRSTSAALALFCSSHSDLFDLQFSICSDVDSSRIGGIQHRFMIQVPGRCFGFLLEDFPLRSVPRGHA